MAGPALLLFLPVVAGFVTGPMKSSECSAQGREAKPAACVGSSVLQLKSSMQEQSQTRIAEKPAIPCSIHQTWKTNNESELSDKQLRGLQSFKEMNPSCKHKLWSDAQVLDFMKTEHPELKDMWQKLKPVERADIFRYAVILKHGGYYADLDVVCMKPIEDWGMNDKTELVLGYETGHHLSEDEMKASGFSRSEQFEQWLFAAIPGHPVLRAALDLFSQRSVWFILNTIELTGPGLFSDAVHSYLYGLKTNESDTAGNSVFSSKTMTKQKEHRKVKGKASNGTQLLKWGSARARRKREALRKTEALQFPPGWRNDTHIFIFSADAVAAPGYSTQGVNDQMIIRHEFEGTWKEKEKEKHMWP